MFALNSVAILYLILATKMMISSDYKKMLQISELQDEGQVVILILALGAVITSLVTIVAELSMAKELHGVIRYGHIALAAFTIVTSWTFIHFIFALHYAHDYYLNLSHKKSGGLEFPGETLPDYADFIYFSCVIGTSDKRLM
ncbi:MAG: DUF1345 domain-containing protein [Bacteriovorax sp.]|nr:DUF1345 domain-containing protein [Bacteriovorax sp.]